jgi:hypothetical protein
VKHWHTKLPCLRHERQHDAADRAGDAADQLGTHIFIPQERAAQQQGHQMAETRMKILCLEQGDWIKSTEFPSNGRDREARRYTDFDISPNRPAWDTDYPINDDNSVG